MFAAVLALIPTGCGGSADRPPLGQVHGRVTLDGKPLAKVAVVFQPVDGPGRQSSAVTDANGDYVLKYIRDDLGATVGKNSVRISKQKGHDLETETVPLKYNQQTTLTVDVQPGENEIPFDLTSF